MRLGGDSDCSLSGVTLNGLLAPLENRELFAVDADDAVGDAACCVCGGGVSPQIESLQNNRTTNTTKNKLALVNDKPSNALLLSECVFP